MILTLYAVKDVKAGFSDPVSLRSDAEALKVFSDFVSDIFANPDKYFVPVRDFQLWRLGLFDLDSGFISCDNPALVADGASFTFEEVADEK